MLKVFTPEMMRLTQEYTVIKRQITPYNLMEEAGNASCDFFISAMKPAKSSVTLVISGPGNNGIDAIYFALELVAKGFNTILYTTIDHEFIDRLSNVKKQSLSNDKQLVTLKTYLLEADFVIDGLFGTGLNREVTGFYREIIHLVNEAKKRVYSIDIPSGIDGFSGLVRGFAIQAELCGTIGFLKTGNLLNDAFDHSIKTLIVPMNFSVPENVVGYDFLDEETISMPPRLHQTHKYNYGNVLTVGGSDGMFGSVQLSAMAALRSGVGLSTIAIQKKDSSYFSQVYAEIIIKRYDTVFDFEEIIRNYSGILFGPGMRLGKNSLLFLEKCLETGKPVVIDASALDLVPSVGRKDVKNVVLTPHAGELSRICYVSSIDILRSPLKYVESLTALGYIVVLKGPITIVSSKELTVLIKSGNPGMATAGMGDVLAGIILGFSQLNMPLFESVKLAVLLHSKSGNLACKRKGEMSLIASDLFDEIPHIIKQGGKA